MHANIRCWGGNLMKKAGGTLVKDYKELAFMGFIEVLRHLKTILKNLKFCKKDIEKFNPDVIVYIDYPGFNLRIAKWAKKRGVTWKNPYRTSGLVLSLSTYEGFFDCLLVACAPSPLQGFARSLGWSPLATFRFFWRVSFPLLVGFFGKKNLFPWSSVGSWLQPNRMDIQLSSSGFPPATLAGYAHRSTWVWQCQVMFGALQCPQRSETKVVWFCKKGADSNLFSVGMGMVSAQ